MTTEHDFQKALNAYENNRYDTPQEWVSCAGVIGDRELDETIRFALRLADKLLKQEVSEGMKWCPMSMNVWHTSKCDCGARTTTGTSANKRAELFTAMLTTAVQEIEND